jgi:hypothetical protein
VGAEHRARRVVAEVINLRRARKAKVRADAAAQASVNRAAFGRTRAQKQAEQTDADRLARTIDGARLEDQADARPDRGESKHPKPRRL